MRRKRRILSVLTIIVTLIIMLLPVSEAGAESSASDFRMEGSTLVKYRGSDKNVTIPSTVEVIGRSAFEDNKNVELVVLSNSVKRIDPYAFWGCENLDTVVLGRGLSEVGDYAFAKCTGLEQMTLPANVTAVGIQAFGDCTNLRDISIPNETKSIHETAFDGCTQLTIHCEEGSAADDFAKDFYERQKNMPGYGEASDESPSGTVSDPAQPSASDPPASDSVGSGTSGNEPSIPAEVPGDLLGSTHVVGNRAVVMVNNMQLQVYGSERGQESGVPAGDISVDSLNGEIPKYTIVDGKIVADQAYYNNSELSDLALPEGIQEIGEFSFARSSVASVVLPEGVEHIGFGAFYHCDELRDMVLPDTVMCVEPKAFSHTMWVDDFLKGESASAEDDFLITGGVLVAYRGNAADVTVPEGVRVIAGEVFQNHTEIESITLPDSLLVVGEGAFEGCSNLSHIVLGKNVEEIKDRAFLGNTMSEVSVPASVKKVGLQAFGNALIAYEGGEAEYTYETSATRLSNSDYRGASSAGEQTPGVTVMGLEALFGASAAEKLGTGWTSLSEADRSYILSVSQAEDTAAMEAAFERVFKDAIPVGMLLYGLELTDESNIPLKRLGKQTLSVVLPVPDALKGQELTLFTLDGNGQLEKLVVEVVDADGVEAFRFETNHPSVIGVCGAGVADSPLKLDTINDIVVSPDVVPSESPVVSSMGNDAESSTESQNVIIDSTPVPDISSEGNVGITNNPFNTHDNPEQQNTVDTYVLNTNTKLIHHPDCQHVRKIAEQNYATSNESIGDLESQGYRVCKVCFRVY